MVVVTSTLYSSAYLVWTSINRRGGSVSERELKYLREIVRASHRPRIGSDRTCRRTAVRARDPVCTYADFAEPNGQAQRLHEIPHHVAGPAMGRPSVSATAG
jgi:hypothetical protein